MAKPSEELTKKRADRAKGLFEWWKAEHPAERKTQQELAGIMDISPIVLNAKLNGKRTLTEKDARAIAAYFPGSRFEYIMCYDNYITWEERTKAILDKAADDATALDVLIRRILKDQESMIKLFKKENAPDGIQLDEDCYAIIKHNQVVGFISINEYIALRHEIADFAAYTVGKKVSNVKAQLLTPFPYTKEI